MFKWPEVREIEEKIGQADMPDQVRAKADKEPCPGDRCHAACISRHWHHPYLPRLADRAALEAGHRRQHEHPQVAKVLEANH